MDAYSEWTGPNVITPPTTSESFTLDFKHHPEVLAQPEFKVLLNNRWGVKIFPFKEIVGVRPTYTPSAFDVVTGRSLDGSLAIVPVTPSGSVEVQSRYQSFSLLIQPIPTRFELDEMCNLWDRSVTIYFDLHVGGTLLQPYVQGDTRGSVRSLNRHEQRVHFKSGPTPKTGEWLHICASSTLLDQAGFFAKDDFRIIIRIDSHHTRPDGNLLINQADAVRRESFGARLLDPKHGDIIFRFPAEITQNSLEEKTLFASSELLCRFSPYFKQLLHGEFREAIPQSLEFQVKYDTDPNTNIPALRSLLSGNRKAISVQNARFTDSHNTLYYIYTGSLNLRFSLAERPLSSGAGYVGWEATAAFPRKANPNEIYRLAGMMGLAELQTRAYHYLMSTCSVDNILDRLFDPYCKAATHIPVRQLYQQYLSVHWDEVRGSTQWASLLRRYRSTQMEDEANFLLEVLCEILSAVTWDHKQTRSTLHPKTH